MAWHRPGDKPLSEPMMASVTDAYMRHSASKLTHGLSQAGRWSCNLGSVTFKLLSRSTKDITWAFPVKIRQVNATRPHWCLSRLVQVMAWCRQATSHYLSQCWSRSLSPYEVSRSQWVNPARVGNIREVCMVLDGLALATLEPIHQEPMHGLVYFYRNIPASASEGLIYWGMNKIPEIHDDVIKWRHFPRYWPFVRGIHLPPVNSPHKGQWRGALMFSLICV